MDRGLCREAGQGNQSGESERALGPGGPQDGFATTKEPGREVRAQRPRQGRGARGRVWRHSTTEGETLRGFGYTGGKKIRLDHMG